MKTYFLILASLTPFLTTGCVQRAATRTRPPSVYEQRLNSAQRNEEARQHFIKNFNEADQPYFYASYAYDRYILKETEAYRCYLEIQATGENNIIIVHKAPRDHRIANDESYWRLFNQELLPLAKAKTSSQVFFISNHIAGHYLVGEYHDVRDPGNRVRHRLLSSPPPQTNPKGVVVMPIVRAIYDTSRKNPSDRLRLWISGASLLVHANERYLDWESRPLIDAASLSAQDVAASETPPPLSDRQQFLQDLRRRSSSTANAATEARAAKERMREIEFGPRSDPIRATGPFTDMTMGELLDNIYAGQFAHHYERSEENYGHRAYEICVAYIQYHRAYRTRFKDFPGIDWESFTTETYKSEGFGPSVPLGDLVTHIVRPQFLTTYKRTREELKAISTLVLLNYFTKTGSTMYAQIPGLLLNDFEKFLERQTSPNSPAIFQFEANLSRMLESKSASKN